MSTLLKDLRKKTEHKLPESGGTVFLYDKILVGDFRSIIKSGKEAETAGFDILLKIIADWDFVDEDGNKMPINDSSIDLLPAQDLGYLSTEVSKLTEGQIIGEAEKKSLKKNST